MTEISELIEVMAQLRHPENGCAWDVEQTFSTIAPYTIEEAYEVLDAIEREDMVDLRDELGDLLLQVVFHARMAEEVDEFRFEDVVQSIVDKMIRRHPHVFGVDGDPANKPVYANTLELKQAWESKKSEERLQKAANSAKANKNYEATDKPVSDKLTSHLDGIANSLPALTKAAKIQRRAARVGFDWDSLEGVLAKVDEELAELRAAIAENKPEAIAEEVGDFLFTAVNLCRHCKVEPEQSLRDSTNKFSARFRHMESLVNNQRRLLEDQSAEEFEVLWQHAKIATVEKDSQ